MRVQHDKRYYIIFLICLPILSWAQLRVYPIETREKHSDKNTTAARMASGSLSLPFWDDFSFVSGDRPVDSLWAKGASVLVSSGQGINPPSVNVATFDGLNENGVAYSASPTDILDYGYRDTLESQSIKLNEVLLAHRDSIFLSFFYQWGGNGEPPDDNDFLRLEFRNNDSVWETIATIRKEDDFDHTVFYDTAIKITAARFFHPDFRFRFISFGRKSGRYDAWHVDYVYLNRRGKNEVNKTSISDRTMTKPFTSVLVDYYAMPYTHFKSNPALNFVKPIFEAYNLKDTSFAQVINYTSYFTIINYTNEVADTTYDAFLEIEEGLDPALGSLMRNQYEIKTLPDVAAFDMAADAARVVARIALNSGDNDEDYYVRYNPIDFYLNDTVTQIFNLQNFYAFDDGVAEYAAGNAQAGNQLAYRFDLKTNAEDTINGLYIYYPFFAGTTPSNMTLFIWSNVNGEPGEILYEQLVPVARTANNLFTEIELLYGIPVQGSFFIGYTEPSTGRVRIGLDKSNDTGLRMYTRNHETAAWLQNDRVTGSLMIRPRFGPGNVISGLPEPQPEITFYPNPNSGEFYMQGSAQVTHVISMDGQPIPFTTEILGDRTRVTLVNASGLYVVRYSTGNAISSQKIFVKP